MKVIDYFDSDRKAQWRSEDVDVPLMHEKRTGYVSLMTKEDWMTGHKGGAMFYDANDTN